jgi:hypothetical protein
VVVGQLDQACRDAGQEQEVTGVDFMKPFWPKFTDKTEISQILGFNCDFMWI